MRKDNSKLLLAVKFSQQRRAEIKINEGHIEYNLLITPKYLPHSENPTRRNYQDIPRADTHTGG